MSHGGFKGYMVLLQWNSNVPVIRLHELYGFPEPANEHMVAIIDMYHNTVITLTFIFASIIYIVAACIYYFRSSVNPHPYAFTKWQESMIDAFVVLLPLLIIYYLSVPAVGYILHVDRLTQYLDTSFNLEIAGHQWYWSYYLDCIQNEYLFDAIYFVKYESILNTDLVDQMDEMVYDSEYYQIEFDQYMDLDSKEDRRYLAVNQVLVLPVNEAIKCLVSSEDVIHSWALPQLGIKVDAIPGRVQMFVLTSNRCGIFYGQCSELCGVNHAFMPICVEFTVQSLFMDWSFKISELRPYKVLIGLLED